MSSPLSGIVRRGNHVLGHRRKHWAGKTSLAQMISRELGFSVYFEAFGENPFLPSYYQDMRRWAFATQISFLALRYEQILNHVLMSDVPAILDRSIYEDREIFAKALVRDGLLSSDEWNTYDKLYQLMVRRLPNPNLLVYLRRDVPTLLQTSANAIAAREHLWNYLEGLNQQYESSTRAGTTPRSCSRKTFSSMPQMCCSLSRESSNKGLSFLSQMLAMLVHEPRIEHGVLKPHNGTALHSP